MEIRLERKEAADANATGRHALRMIADPVVVGHCETRCHSRERIVWPHLRGKTPLENLRESGNEREPSGSKIGAISTTRRIGLPHGIPLVAFLGEEPFAAVEEPARQTEVVDRRDYRPRADFLRRYPHGAMRSIRPEQGVESQGNDWVGMTRRSSAY